MMEQRFAFARRAGLLAVTLLAVNCSDSVGPKRNAVGSPAFSFSPNGITLNTHSGALGYQATTNIIKGFDAAHPRNGDAIIASVYWVNGGNRANLVAAVTDHRTDA